MNKKNNKDQYSETIKAMIEHVFLTFENFYDETSDDRYRHQKLHAKMFNLEYPDTKPSQFELFFWDLLLSFVTNAYRRYMEIQEQDELEDHNDDEEYEIMFMSPPQPLNEDVMFQ